MAFVKLQIEFYLIDSLRHGNTTQICQAIICACSCADDNVTYMGRGLATTISTLTGIPQRSIRNSLVALQERGFLTKYDEFSCQVNPAYMQKSSKKVKYTGNLQAHPDSKESQFLLEVHTLALESWELRGKNYRKHIKEDGEMIKQLQKEIKEERKEAAERFEKLTGQLQFIIDNFVQPQDKHKAAEIIQLDDFRKTGKK